MQRLAAARATFPPHVRLPFPELDHVMRVQDKREVLRLATTVGIEIPQTYMLREEEQIEDVARRITYPAVIKPRFSCRLTGDNLVHGAVHYAADPASLTSEYSRIHAVNPYPMVQERIEGEGHGVFLLIWNGTVRAAFAHRRLREKPPWGGVSTLSESVPLGHEILVKSARLLKALGWQGVAMAEFKRDRRDGRSKLMEVNGRFWGSLQLAIDAGVNFPLLLYRLSRGEDPPTQFDYKVGVKSLWLLGDLDHLLIQLGRSYLSGAGGGRKSRWRAIRDFLDIFENWRRLEIERSDDLSPAWFEWRNYVREVL